MRSPILFLIFNRPDTTKQVFETIRQARPPRLYIAADGPRPNRPQDRELCEQTRAIATAVDWDCEVKTLFREENLGCGNSVSQAITWFFNNESEGIILEDDILAHPDFFKYCDDMLERYRASKNIGVIAGHNHFYKKFERTASYAFQNLPAIWGWATWSHVWNEYDFNLNFDKESFRKKIKQTFAPNSYRRFWYNMFDVMRQHKIDTWDFQFVISLMMKDRISIVPYVNLTRNIGFGDNSTHTANDHNNEGAIIAEPIYPIHHPDSMDIDVEAQCRVIEMAKWKLTWPQLLKQKIKRKIKQILSR